MISLATCHTTTGQKLIPPANSALPHTQNYQPNCTHWTQEAKAFFTLNNNCQKKRKKDPSHPTLMVVEAILPILWNLRSSLCDYAMEALNAVGLTPLSVLSERRTEPRKISSLPTSSPIKFPLSVNFSHNPQKISKNFSRNLHGGLLLLSSVLSSGFARSLTYEEALQQSASSSPSMESSEFDFGGFIDSIINFGVENPLVIAGGVALLGVPLFLSQVFSSPKPWGVESPKNAYAKLGDDSTCQLVDIRPPVEVRQVGGPDIRGLKKRPVGVAYRGEDKVGFLKKLSLKFKEPEKTTLFILDK